MGAGLPILINSFPLFKSYSFYGGIVIPGYSGMDSFVIKVKIATPLSKCLGLSLICYHVISSFVLALFVSSRPLYVARLIIAVVVDPVKFVFVGWARANVFIKRLKRVHPFIADRYSTSAVIIKKWMFDVGASILHPRPRTPFRGLRHAMRSHVWMTFFPTTARSSFPCEVTRCDYSSVATIAFAKPIDRPAISTMLFNNGKFANFLSSSVNKIFTNFSHNRSFLFKVVKCTLKVKRK